MTNDFDHFFSQPEREIGRVIIFHMTGEKNCVNGSYVT